MTLCIFKTQGKVKKKGKQTAFLEFSFTFIHPAVITMHTVLFSAQILLMNILLGTCTFSKETLTNPLISGQPALPFEP